VRKSIPKKSSEPQPYTIMRLLVSFVISLSGTDNVNKNGRENYHIDWLYVGNYSGLTIAVIALSLLEDNGGQLPIIPI